MAQQFFAEPFIKTSFIKHQPTAISVQLNEHCGKFELQIADCIEAYGWDRGRVKCSAFIEDFYECLTNKKQKKRVMFMMEERKRQMQNGERDYLPAPPVDLY